MRRFLGGFCDGGSLVFALGALLVCLLKERECV